MTEHDPAAGKAAAPDLRTIRARLSDLQRKCRSAGSNTSEAVEMENRLASVLERLAAADADTVEAVPFAALARELYTVERFFESNGFLTVAKEVAHVERALERLAAPAEATATPAARSEIGRPSPVDGDDELESATSNEVEEPMSRWAVPRPLAIMVALLVIAIVVCVGIIVRHRQAQVARGPIVLAVPTPHATVAPASPTPAADRRPTAPAPGAVLATEVGKARLALVGGDVDAAIDHLSRAALIDADHATVLSTAGQIVELLVDRADAAAEGGLWEVADLTLNRAEGIAARFGLEKRAIDEVRERHARMDRFRLVRPTDTAAISAATGARVTVFFKDGTTRDSIIKGVEAGDLLLDEDTEVRGGALYYTEEIPLTSIDYLKVWED